MCIRDRITSALADQLASERGPVAGLSLFTACLIEGLEGGITGHDGLVTGSQLGRYVQQRVRSYPTAVQTPDFAALELDDRGDILIPTFAAETPRSTQDHTVNLERFERNMPDVVELGPVRAVRDAPPSTEPHPESTNVGTPNAGPSA